MSQGEMQGKTKVERQKVGKVLRDVQGRKQG
jgi:hypothetical protein